MSGRTCVGRPLADTARIRYSDCIYIDRNNYNNDSNNLSRFALTSTTFRSNDLKCTILYEFTLKIQRNERIFTHVEGPSSPRITERVRRTLDVHPADAHQPVLQGPLAQARAPRAHGRAGRVPRAVARQLHGQQHARVLAAQLRRAGAARQQRLAGRLAVRAPRAARRGRVRQHGRQHRRQRPDHRHQPRRPALLDHVYVHSVRHDDRRVPARAQRPLGRRVVHGHPALVVRRVRQFGQLLDLRLEVHVDDLDVGVEGRGVAPSAGAAAAVLEVQAGQVLEHFVQGLLLVFVGFA